MLALIYEINLTFMLLQVLCQDNIKTTVGIEYDNDNCGTNLTAPPELNLTLPIGSTALDIMEGAVNITKNYRFVVTFLGEMGYRIDSVNGTASGERCKWHMIISEGSLTGTVAQLHYVLPSNVTMAILHYTTEQVIMRKFDFIIADCTMLSCNFRI